MKETLYLFIFTIIICTINGQRSGPCPAYKPMENFDLEKFKGTWYEVERTMSLFDLAMRCLSVNYNIEKDGTLKVNVFGPSIAGLPARVSGDGMIPDANTKGHYIIRFVFGLPFQGTHHYILDTDYTEYAVVYSCTNSLIPNVLHSGFLWILSRNGKIENATRQNIYELLDKLSVPRSGLTLTDRTNCPKNETTFREEAEEIVLPKLNLTTTIKP